MNTVPGKGYTLTRSPYKPGTTFTLSDGSTVPAGAALFRDYGHKIEAVGFTDHRGRRYPDGRVAGINLPAVDRDTAA